MATKSQKMKVGIFLVVGAFLIAGIFVGISLRNRKPTSVYHIKLEESVSGLGQDAKVVYRGVPVGKVIEVRVNDRNEVIATLGVERDLVTLREGTEAKLDWANLMGTPQIELTGGKLNAPILKPGSFIPSKASVMGHLEKDLPAILDEIKTILAKINRSIGDVDEDRVGQLVRDADTVVLTANEALRELTSFLQTMRGAVFNTQYETTQTMRAFREAVIPAERTLQQLGQDPSSIIWGRSGPENPYVR